MSQSVVTPLRPERPVEQRPQLLSAFRLLDLVELREDGFNDEAFLDELTDPFTTRVAEPQWLLDLFEQVGGNGHSNIRHGSADCSQPNNSLGIPSMTEITIDIDDSLLHDAVVAADEAGESLDDYVTASVELRERLYNDDELVRGGADDAE